MKLNRTIYPLAALAVLFAACDDDEPNLRQNKKAYPEQVLAYGICLKTFVFISTRIPSVSRRPFSGRN